MKEKLVFIMPESLEELLYASVILPQYLISRMVVGRSTEDVVIACREPQLHHYLKCCWYPAVIELEPTQEQLNGADLVFEFSGKTAYQISVATEKHMAETMAVQLGVGLLRFLPPVLVENVKEEVGLLLVAERNELDGTDDSWLWPNAQEFFSELKAADVPVAYLEKGASWEQTREAVGRASVVVGVRGAATTIAAAAYRVVLELTPKDKAHSEWVRKKECSMHRMLYGDLKEMSAAYVWIQLSKLMKDSRGKRIPDGNV